MGAEVMVGAVGSGRCPAAATPARCVCRPGLSTLSPGRFAPAALAAAQDGASALSLSAASCRASAGRVTPGKLPLPMSPAERVPSRPAAGGVLALPVSAPLFRPISCRGV